MIYIDEIINEMEKELDRIPRSAIRKAYEKGFENGRTYENARVADAYQRGHEEGKKSNESIIKDLNQDLTDVYKQLMLDEKAILEIREILEGIMSDVSTNSYLEDIMTILEIIRKCMKGQTK